MMMDHLGEPEMSASIEGAVRAVLADGKVLTADLGGRSTTADVTAAVLAHLA